MKPRPILRHLRNRARTLRNDPTPAEVVLWQAIRYDQLEGLRFLRQHVVGPYVVDFYCARMKLVIEVDGGIHAVPDVEKYDRQRQDTLEQEHQLRVLRFSNDEVLQHSPRELRERIREYLQSNPLPTP